MGGWKRGRTGESLFSPLPLPSSLKAKDNAARISLLPLADFVARKKRYIKWLRSFRQGTLTQRDGTGIPSSSVPQCDEATIEIEWVEIIAPEVALFPIFL